MLLSVHSTIAPQALRAAVDQLAAARPWRAERLTAAGWLLLRGGWCVTDDALHFANGVVACSDHCTCQEGTAIECLHKIAIRELLPLAAQLAAPAASIASDTADQGDTPTSVAATWPPPSVQRACIARTPTLTLWRWRPVLRTA